MAKLCATARLALGLVAVAAAADEQTCADGGDSSPVSQDGSSGAPSSLGQKGGSNARVPMKTDSDSGFHARLDRSIWAEQLKRSVADGAKHSCESDVVSSAFNRPIGLGNRIHTFAAHLLLAVYGGHSFSIFNDTSTGKDDMTRIWAMHFENSAGFSFCRGDPPPLGNKVKLDWDFLNGHLSTVDREYQDDFKRFLYPLVWTVNSNTWNRVHTEWRKAGLDVSRPYVGVHLRRGDKFTEASPVEIGAYADAIRPWLESSNSGGCARQGASLKDVVGEELGARKIEQVFLCSDDELAAEELQTALGNRVRIVTPPPSDTKTRSYDSEESILGVITAVEGLRRAHVFVGTASSNLGRLVFFLRPKGSRAISLDRGGQW